MIRTRALPAIACILMLSACLPPAGVDAAEVTVGWALTHVGLDDDGGGLVLGVGERSRVAPGLDLRYAAEYAQKRGAQPMIFTTETNPSLRADAEVTLHVVQVVALLEMTAPAPALPRPYAGLSAAAKVSEQWSAFPGDPTQEWGYKDVDFLAHAGLARDLGPLRLDLRYSRGLTRQLIAQFGAAQPLKAVDPLPGVDAPVPGAHLWQVQLSAGLAF